MGFEAEGRETHIVIIVMGERNKTQFFGGS